MESKIGKVEEVRIGFLSESNHLDITIGVKDKQKFIENYNELRNKQVNLCKEAEHGDMVKEDFYIKNENLESNFYSSLILDSNVLYIKRTFSPLGPIEISPIEYGEIVPISIN